MSGEQIFPKWKIHLRNALCVAGIVFVSTLPMGAPESLIDFYPSVIGFISSLILEFSHAYYKKTPARIVEPSTQTFFLA